MRCILLSSRGSNDWYVDGLVPRPHLIIFIHVILPLVICFMHTSVQMWYINFMHNYYKAVEMLITGMLMVLSPDPIPRFADVSRETLQ